MKFDITEIRDHTRLKPGKPVKKYKSEIHKIIHEVFNGSNDDPFGVKDLRDRTRLK